MSRISCIVVMLFLLVGCGGNVPPTPTATPTVVPTIAPTPTATPRIHVTYSLSLGEEFFIVFYFNEKHQRIRVEVEGFDVVDGVKLTYNPFLEAGDEFYFEADGQWMIGGKIREVFAPNNAVIVDLYSGFRHVPHPGWAPTPPTPTSTPLPANS